MNNRRWTVLAALLALAAPLRAQEREVALTIYNNDLALVRDARRMALKPGGGELRFADVAAQIDPTSVHFRSLEGEKASVLEQNYEYDLVSAEKILGKYLDQEVQITVKDGKLFEGKLLSAAGDVVLEKKDGSIQSLAKAAIVNVDFPKLPAGLITRPTLVWSLAPGEGGPRRMEVSYLTGGIGWHAEYVGVVDKDDKKLDLSAWVSVDNRSGASYENAKLKLIAGDVHRAQPEPRPQMVRMAMMKAEDAGEQFEERAFFEYHLYSLSRPATVKDNQVKQLSLFAPASVPVKKRLSYDGAHDPKKVRVELEFVNAKGEGLGMPLPAGKIRVYKQDADQSQEFVGEDRIDHTPKDEKVTVAVGNAFDVVGERRQKEVRNLGTRSRQESYEIKLRNHKDADVEVIVVERFHGEWEIVRNTHQFEKKDASTAEFRVPVKKDSETLLEYAVVTRW